MDPGLNGHQLKARLFETADDLGNMGPDDLFSNGRVNAYMMAVAAPEPSTGILLLFGVGGLAGLAAMRDSV